MTFLTLFSAFLLPLTLITSFYWMNVVLPFQNHTQFIYIFLLISIFIMLFIFLYFKKNGKI
jgi:magnesium transporter